ncbi:helix-turn-helix domain-containing protein [Natrinema caseinilyticum]|uniref:helix-turn-helix domain-containing protein n=1 Tax=Natrinema caseinilyticum TaxID=2961570 RepID=UPI0020C25094|nr:helix-turn-helix domain-containing protein [Natrinema caseinilyticum]
MNSRRASVRWPPDSERWVTRFNDDYSDSTSTTAFVHFVPNETVTDLLTIFDTFTLVLDTPLEFTRHGELSVQVYGTDAAIRSALERVPNDVSLKIGRIGEYRSEADRLYGTLTERQREILDAALDAGYYSAPREATHEDIAETLDLSAGTVGDHLRKIEANVLAVIGR